MPVHSGYTGVLSGVIDCAVCHACLGLNDTPAPLVNASGALDEAGLFGSMDAAETAAVLWPLSYHRSLGEQALRRYARLQFGPYFAVLLDRMQAAVEAAGEPGGLPVLYVQVMSDTNVLPHWSSWGWTAMRPSGRPGWRPSSPSCGGTRAAPSASACSTTGRCGAPAPARMARSAPGPSSGRNSWSWCPTGAPARASSTTSASGRASWPRAVRPRDRLRFLSLTLRSQSPCPSPSFPSPSSRA
ncbi:unnamed protein product, partial [Prorocentrum cordatum]